MGIKSMVKTRGKERNSSLIQGVPIARLSPSSCRMVLVLLGSGKTETDLSSYRTDIPVLPFTVNMLEVYLGRPATSYLLRMQNATRVGR